MLAYFLALFSNIFVGFEHHFRETIEVLGIEGLLFGWFTSTSKISILPLLSNLIYWYLILFGKYFNFLRLIFCLVMIFTGLLIFNVSGVTIGRMMDNYHYTLTPASGIYLWLSSYILLSIHYFIGDWKLYRNLKK